MHIHRPMGPRVRARRFRILAAAMTATVAVMLSGCASPETSQPTSDEHYIIAITHVSRLSVIDDNIAAFKDALADAGYVEGDNVTYVQQDANGQRSNIGLLARSIVDRKPDLIYALGTDLNLALNQLTTGNILFGLMTDPLGSGVVQDLNEPGKNTSGTSDYIDPATYFDYLQLALPDAKVVGLMGNTGETNTELQIELFQKEAESRGLETVVVPVPTTNDIVPSIRSLSGRVDVILVGADATLSSADEVVVTTATDAGIPVVFNGSGEAKKGALLGIGPDYAKLGTVSGQQAAEVLGGKSPGEIPVAFPGDLDLVAARVNAKVAAQFNIDISDELKSRATVVGD